LENGVYEKIVSEFTQNDILDNKVFYRHVGPHRSDFVMDRIHFNLQDCGDPPNNSDLKELIVKVRSVACLFLCLLSFVYAPPFPVLIADEGVLPVRPSLYFGILLPPTSFVFSVVLRSVT
jgi:hypothetical protein